MGNTAENLAEMNSNVSREDQDAFALWSQQKATAAMQSGRLAEEIISVEIPQRKKDPILFANDEFIKPSSSSAGILAKLRPAFKKDGTVTAGNASGLNDGSAAMLLATEEGLKTHNLTPMAKVLSWAVVGVEPRIMGIGPVGASQEALKKAHGRINQILLN